MLNCCPPLPEIQYSIYEILPALDVSEFYRFGNKTKKKKKDKAKNYVWIKS